MSKTTDEVLAHEDRNRYHAELQADIERLNAERERSAAAIGYAEAWLEGRRWLARWIAPALYDRASESFDRALFPNDGVPEALLRRLHSSGDQVQ